MRRIAVINQKGGVGKTTTCANLGAALARSGRRVVLVDMDAQANLTLSLNIQQSSASLSSYSVLTGGSSFGGALRDTSTPNLRILPADIDLSGAELELSAQLGREHVLREAIEEWEAEARRVEGRAPADYVFFDCPPSLGLLSVNALAAAGEVLIVIQTEFLALQGMSKLVEILKLLKKRLNPKLEVAGIVPCLYDSRLKLAREVLGEIRGYFPGKVGASVRSNVKLAEAPSFGQTIFEYAPESNGARDYMAVAREIAQAESRDPDLAALPPLAGSAPRARAAEDFAPTTTRDASESKAAPKSVEPGGESRSPGIPAAPAVTGEATRTRARKKVPSVPPVGPSEPKSTTKPPAEKAEPPAPEIPATPAIPNEATRTRTRRKVTAAPTIGPSEPKSAAPEKPEKKSEPRAPEVAPATPIAAEATRTRARKKAASVPTIGPSVPTIAANPAAEKAAEGAPLATVVLKPKARPRSAPVEQRPTSADGIHPLESPAGRG